MKSTSPAKPALTELNDLKMPDYAKLLGGILERSPHLAARTWYARPFLSLNDLHRAFVNVVRTLSESEQVTLIKAHPDLLQKIGNFSDTLESGAPGEREARLTDEQTEGLARLNQRYTRRFGFPFIIRTRGRTPADIQTAFEARLPQERPVEMINALDEICDIARVRISDLFGN